MMDITKLEINLGPYQDAGWSFNISSGDTILLDCDLVFETKEEAKSFAQQVMSLLSGASYQFNEVKELF